MRNGPRRASEPLGLRAWYREVYTASGGLVTEWTDKSGNAFHATASGGARPSEIASDAGVNNNPSFDFNNNDAFTGVAFSNVISATAFSVYVGYTTTTLGYNNSALEDNAAFICRTTTPYHFAFMTKSGGSSGLYAAIDTDGGASGNAVLAGPVTATINTWKIAVMRKNGTTLFVRNRGGTEASAACGDASDLSDIFAIGGPSTGFSGRLFEVRFYNKSHSAGAQDTIMSNMAAYAAL